MWRTLRFLISTILVATMLSGCIWRDEGGRGGGGRGGEHEHGGDHGGEHGGDHDERR